MASSLLVVGCSHTPPPVGVTYQNHLIAQKRKEKNLSRLAGTLQLSFWGQQSGTGYGQMISALPKIFRMELRDPVGNLHFLMAMKGRTFVAKHVKNKVAYTDKRGGAHYLSFLLGLPFPFEDFHRLTLGLTPKSWQLPGGWTWDGGEGHFVMRGKGFRLYSKDGEHLSRVESEWRGGRFVLNYGDIRSCCGGQFPMAHKAEFEIEGRRSGGVKLRWKKLSAIKKAPPVKRLWPDLKGFRTVSLPR